MEVCSSRSLSESLGSVPDEAASPRRGLQKYLSRFDDAMKLRGQLCAEKTSQDGGGEEEQEELDSFRLVRLVCSVALAVFVRVFVCQYLVRAAQTLLILTLVLCLISGYDSDGATQIDPN